tara:strand:- start:1026 stop:1433 length:408 start_codon:yes stop_codon:yes gene_type:complete
MGIRCEVCDNFLSVFQLSRLCDNCYKVRTIAKCYSSEEVLDCLEQNFKVDYIKRTKSLPTILEEEGVDAVYKRSNTEQSSYKKPDAYKNVSATATAEPVASNDMVFNEQFRKELEDKVVKSIETRQQKHKKNKSH